MYRQPFNKMSKKANPIIQSWEFNAKKWIKTIENDEIESRRLVTNSAILKNILKRKPEKVLDIGCGEGWLVNTLAKHKIRTTGVDAVASLIENAKSKGKGTFKIASYEKLTKGISFKNEPFDLISINFALFENNKTAKLLKKLPDYLTKNGKVIIQTLHPCFVDMDEFYKSGWKENNWKGLKRNFTQPHSWYFRTLKDWIKLFKKIGLKLEEIEEPIHPKTGRPASIIFVLK